MSEEEIIDKKIIDENIRRYIKEHTTTIKAYTQEYVDNLQNQLQQKESIIKEVREYILSTKYEWGDLEQDNEDFDIDVYELLEILDKEKE